MAATLLELKEVQKDYHIRQYGRVIRTYNALNKLSFKVKKGQIFGFLGPNGAGKTTTIKCITGILKCDKGTIFIDGKNIENNGFENKNKIGFLPEQLPLYNDLTVDEYLFYTARLRNIKKVNLGEKVTSCKRRCGLETSGKRLIQNLSKGYKQRVGIAQAIIHTPSVIILDEPTSGLDPKQIIEIRKLMSELSIDHSIMLSTHILSEVEAICDRVLIINNGSIVLDQYLKELLANGDSLESTFMRLTENSTQ